MDKKRQIVQYCISFLLIIMLLFQTFRAISFRNECTNLQETLNTITQENDLLKEQNKQFVLENENLEVEVSQLKTVQSELEKKINEISVKLKEYQDKEAEQQKKTEELRKASNTTKNITTIQTPEKTTEREILAKLLYREAGGMTWEGQVYTCSAILNLRDYSGRSIWNMAHDKGTFSVAPRVDSAKPTQTQYDVIDYVENGGRVAEICYFRMNRYHNFGTPVCEVDGHYFSKP